MLASILFSIIKKLVIGLLKGAELKYPAISGLFEYIIGLLQGGASASQIQSHLSSMPGPADLVRDR